MLAGSLVPVKRSGIAMWRHVAWLSVAAIVILAGGGALGDVVHQWDKTRILPQMGLNNWRATSFALAKDKVFLTLVDVQKQSPGNGVVGAFNTSETKSPDVSIFPFQNFYKINDPERGKISTPISVRTDECERLWLLDASVQNISGFQIKTAPGIYVFNTKNNQLLRNFKVPPTQWTSASFFVNFVVDTDSPDHDCEESFGYFADFNRFHLLTYDFLRNKSELKSHAFFSPDPLVRTPDDALFNPVHQDLNGLFGMALADTATPYLYFHPLAATREFRVATHVLKTEGAVGYGDIEMIADKGPNSESGVSVFDSDTETIFFAEVNTRKIGALKPKLGAATYYSYDFKLKSGRIVDLSVRRSELWVLVDDPTQIAIHKLPLADILEEASRVSAQTPQTPRTTSSASRRLFASAFLLLPLLVSFFLL